VQKIRLILCAVLLICLMSLNGCITTEKIVYKDVPANYTIIEKEALMELMQSCGQAKMELLECLERERQRK